MTDVRIDTEQLPTPHSAAQRVIHRKVAAWPPASRPFVAPGVPQSRACPIGVNGNSMGKVSNA